MTHGRVQYPSFFPRGLTNMAEKCRYHDCDQAPVTKLGLCKHHGYDPKYRSFRDELREARQNASGDQTPTLPFDTPPALSQGMLKPFPMDTKLAAEVMRNGWHEEISSKGSQDEDPHHHDAVTRMVWEGCPNTKDESCVRKPVSESQLINQAIFESLATESEADKKAIKEITRFTREKMGLPPDPPTDPVEADAELLALALTTNLAPPVKITDEDFAGPVTKPITIRVIDMGGGPNRGGDGFTLAERTYDNMVNPCEEITLCPSNYPLEDDKGNVVGWSQDLHPARPRTQFQKMVDDIFHPLTKQLSHAHLRVWRGYDHLKLLDTRTGNTIWDGSVHSDLHILYDIVRSMLNLPPEWPDTAKKVDTYFGHPARVLAVELRSMGQQLMRMADSLAEVKETRTEHGVSRTFMAYGMDRTPLDACADRDAPPRLPSGTMYTELPVFRRYLSCQWCELMVPIQAVLANNNHFNLHWLEFKFFAKCPACGCEDEFTANDMPQPHKPPFLKVWKPEELLPHKSDIDGKTVWIWKMPEDYKMRIYEGSPFFLEHTPMEVFDALREGKDLHLNSNRVKIA